MKVKIIVILGCILILLTFFYIKYHRTDLNAQQKINKKISNLDDYNEKVCIALLGRQSNTTQTIINIIEQAKSPLRLHFFLLNNDDKNFEAEIFNHLGMNVSVTTFKCKKISYKSSFNTFLKRIPSNKYNLICFIEPKIIKLNKNFDAAFFRHRSNQANTIFTGDSNCYYKIKNNIIPTFISCPFINFDSIPIFAINPFFFFVNRNTFKSLPKFNFAVDKNLLQLYMTQVLLENGFHFYSNSVKYNTMFLPNLKTLDILKSLQKLKKKKFKLNKNVLSDIGVILDDNKIIILSCAQVGSFQNESKKQIIMKHGSVLQYKNKIMEIEA